MKIPTDKEITRINLVYHDKIAGVYDTYEEQNHPKVKELYTEFFRNIFAYFQKKGRRKLKILDVGCGTGYLEEFLIPYKNVKCKMKNGNPEPEIELEILGIDVSGKMLDIARKKYPDVHFRKMDIYDLPKKNKYDLVVENAFLHHLKDYRKCLDDMTRLVKGDGAVFLGAEPNYFCYRYLSIPKWLLRNIFPDRRKMKDDKKNIEALAEYQMYFGNGINPLTLRDYFKKNGFRDIKIRFSSREFVAGLADRIGIRLIDIMPNFMLDSTGIMSRIFYMWGIKNQRSKTKDQILNQSKKTGSFKF